jgi:hypothetical protein
LCALRKLHSQENLKRGHPCVSHFSRGFT